MLKNNSYKHAIDEIISEKLFCELITDEYNALQKLKNIVDDIDPRKMFVVANIDCLNYAVRALNKRYSVHNIDIVVFECSNAGNKKYNILIEKIKKQFPWLKIFESHKFAELLAIDRHPVIVANAKNVFTMNQLLIINGYTTPPYVLAKRNYDPKVGFFRRNFTEIKTILLHTMDSLSRETYLRMIKMIEYGDAGYSSFPTYQAYYHPFVKAQSGDAIYDAGLCNHNVINSFANSVGKLGSCIGFEPVQESVNDIIKALQEKNNNIFSNITIEPFGLWSEENTFFINSSSSGGNKIVFEKSHNMQECNVVALDTYIENKKYKKCDLIKMDIEGAELQALYGALYCVRQYKPKLQICIYHDPSHYIDIPMWIIQQNCGYKLFFGTHSCRFAEHICYATAKV